MRHPALSVLPLLLLLLAACAIRDDCTWDSIVYFSDGIPSKVTQTRSYGHFIGIGHGGGHLFGKNPRHSIKFTDGGKELFWEGKHWPFIVNKWDEHWYIVVYDYEEDPDDPEHGKSSALFHPRFRFFRANTPTKWQEIPAEAFPHEIAVQNINTWYWKTDTNGDLQAMRLSGTSLQESYVLKNFDAGHFDEYHKRRDWHFAHSQTAALWQVLVMGRWRWGEDTPSRELMLSFRPYLRVYEESVSRTMKAARENGPPDFGVTTRRWAETSAALKSGEKIGLIVNDIRYLSTAYSGGIQTDDVLCQFDEWPLSYSQDLRFALSMTHVGKIARIQLFRHVRLPNGSYGKQSFVVRVRVYGNPMGRVGGTSDN